MMNLNNTVLSILESPYLKLFFYLLSLTFVIAVIAPEKIPFTDYFILYAPQLATIYVLLGILFFIFNRMHFMYITFAASSIVAFYLKEVTNEKFIYDRFSETTHYPDFKISMLNVSDYNGNFDAFQSYITQTNDDIIAIQELNPQWDSLIRIAIENEFQYFTGIPRADSYGVGIISKKSILVIDTILYHSVPTLATCIAVENSQCVNIIITHNIPQHYSFSEYQTPPQLEVIADYIRTSIHPSICVGNFNKVSWSSEILDFKKKTNMQDARIGFMPILFDRSIINFFFHNQTNHLFYSNDIICSDFDMISNTENITYAGLKAKLALVPNKHTSGSPVLSYYPF